MMKKRKPDLSGYEGLPDSTLLDSKSVMRVFGYASKRAGCAYAKEGRIPEPFKQSGIPSNRRSDYGFLLNPNNSTSFKRKAFWRLGDLRSLLNE